MELEECLECGKPFGVEDVVVWMVLCEMLGEEWEGDGEVLAFYSGGG